MSNVDVIPINVLPQLPQRAAAGHKGSYGKVLVVAGSQGMTGAAILSGRGALRAGAGLVQVATPIAVQQVVAGGCPCYTTHGIRQNSDGTFHDTAATDVLEWSRAASVLAIGPGLGQAPDASALIHEVIRGLPRTAMVVDADALNAFSPFTAEFKDRTIPLILTPHPGEFSRLSGASVEAIQAHREQVAAEFAARFGVVLLLKGAGTVVTDGRRLYRNSTGNPGMATGGSGDVLTGVIAAMLAQHLPPFEAAVLGAWMHGRAGDLAASARSQTGLIAADLPEYLPQVFRELEL